VTTSIHATDPERDPDLAEPIDDDVLVLPRSRDALGTHVGHASGRPGTAGCYDEIRQSTR
jgi:hypothetical protein